MMPSANLEVGNDKLSQVEMKPETLLIIVPSCQKTLRGCKKEIQRLLCRRGALFVPPFLIYKEGVKFQKKSRMLNTRIKKSPSTETEL